MQSKAAAEGICLSREWVVVHVAAFLSECATLDCVQVKRGLRIIERTNKLLKDLELYEHKDKYPSEVSGGMQQRVAIARSIINNPKVIFGDEPTGALNSSTGKVVLDMLSEINDKGQSIVMVTHDIKTALRANRILYIKDGRIDGELNLGKYTEENARERRERVQEFLEEKSW